MHSYFPKIKRPEGHTPVKQISKILSEMGEVHKALADNEPAERVYEELADVLQAIETLIEEAPFEMRAAIKRVITKNSERGYYAVDSGQD